MNVPPIVSVDDLARLLSNGEDVVVLDARPSDDEYAAGHLRGARHAQADRDLSAAAEPEFDPARGGRHPLPSMPSWLRTVGRWGIGPRTTVVVYDDQSGANAAARAWWMLRSIGHERVSVLDGGWKALQARLPVSTDTPQTEDRGPYPATAWGWPSVDLRQVDALRQDGSWRIIDVRSAPRYRGESEPIDPIAGHIPGAHNVPFAENLDQAGHFKPASDLRAQYQQFLGDTPPDRVVVHCGSGVTACHTLLALEAAGLKGASLYVGSWSEWCRNPMPRQP